MRDKDQNRKRREIVRVALAFTAILPVILGALQILHYCFWIFEWNYDSTDVFYLTKFSVTALVFAFIISLYERFCVFHRLTVLATLYVNCSYYLIDLFPSILLYNVTNLIAVLCILAGIIGCIYHFSLQITDFIRYVRIQSAK